MSVDIDDEGIGHGEDWEWDGDREKRKLQGLCCSISWEIRRADAGVADGP